MRVTAHNALKGYAMPYAIRAQHDGINYWLRDEPLDKHAQTLEMHATAGEPDGVTVPEGVLAYEKVEDAEAVCARINNSEAGFSWTPVQVKSRTVADDSPQRPTIGA